MKKTTIRFVTHSSQETVRWGEKLSQVLQVGDVVLFLADLGAGKTTLVQGITKGLGCDERALSPTFVIAQTLEGRVPLHHLDFYRLKLSEILHLGIPDYLTGSGIIPKGVVLVEWAERIKKFWPKERLEVRIRIKARSRDRKFLLTGYGQHFEEALGRLK